MGSLGDRVKRLEEGSPDYPPHIVAEVMRSLPTGELRSYEEVMRCAWEENGRLEEAKAVVDHLLALCRKKTEEWRN